MYNGIGLQTARGSGTNGFVQRNLSFVRKHKDKVDYKSETEIAKLDASMHKPPNQEILNHERKRKIELKCMEMQELMEEQGYSEEEIEQKVSVFRKMLMENDAIVDCAIECDELGRPIAKETHALQEANLAKNEAFKAALGLSSHYVDGSSLDPNRKLKEEAKRALEMAQTKYNVLQDSSPSPSPSPERKKKKKRRERSESPPARKDKKKKHHKKDKAEDKKRSKKKSKRKSKKKQPQSESSESSESSDSGSESDESPVRKSRRSPVKRRSRSLSYSPIRKSHVVSSEVSRIRRGRSPSRSPSRSPQRRSNRHQSRREPSRSPVRGSNNDAYSPEVKRKIERYARSSPPRNKKHRSPSSSPVRRSRSRSPRRRRRSASRTPSPRRRSRSPRKRYSRSRSRSPRRSRSPSPSPRKRRSRSPRRRRHSRERY